MTNRLKIYKAISKTICINFLKFLENIGFILLFAAIFGSENILPAVAVGVGFTMLPFYDLNIKPWTMFFIILFLYTGSAFAAQSALLSPWIAFPINFIFTALIILLSNEPEYMKPSISFFLAFVFSQAVPLPWDAFASRFACLFFGGLLVGIVTVFMWKFKGYGVDGRNLKEQFHLCKSKRSFLQRMSFGIAIAMFIGSILGLKKPLWISIVVMSLTQLEFHQTLERIKHRFIGTLIGCVIFFIFFQMLIPKQYAAAIVLSLGYIGFFTADYKHKQIINAISALNASLVLLDTGAAIRARILCLLGGILIVLMIYYAADLFKKVLGYVYEKKQKQLHETSTNYQNKYEC